jgi:hypothetical protein
MLVALLALLLLGAPLASTTDEPPDAAPPPADCSLVSGADLESILGVPVQAVDPASRSGGICFFPSRDAAQDGSLSYAIVTADRLPQRRAFYLAYARRCAPAAKGTLNELACRQYLKLAAAQTIDEYFAARTGAGDASPVPGLGEDAVASGNALYVKRGQTVFEVSVVHGDEFDLDAATALAVRLLRAYSQ